MSGLHWLETHGLSVISLLAIVGTILLLYREIQTQHGHRLLWHSCRVSAYLMAMILLFMTLAGFIWCEWKLGGLAVSDPDVRNDWFLWLNRWSLLLFFTYNSVLVLAFSRSSGWKELFDIRKSLSNGQ